MPMVLVYISVPNLFIWWCIHSFPALVLFIVLAFFSWKIFLGGLWLLFTLESSLKHKV